MYYYDIERGFNPGRASTIEGWYWQGGPVVSKCIWGGSCETGGKIKILLWPSVNLRLLTAQRSCCVTGFLMTLQQPLPQIALTWFISPFTTPPPNTTIRPTNAAPPFFLPTSPFKHSVSLSVSLPLCLHRHCAHGTPSSSLHHASGTEHLSLGPPATQC